VRRIFLPRESFSAPGAIACQLFNPQKPGFAVTRMPSKPDQLEKPGTGQAFLSIQLNNL
jgi:hypothetical protein